MKHAFALTLFALFSSLYAQFPAPSKLVDSLKYAHTGETLYCNGQSYSGGTNCHRLVWSAPDTIGITAKLKSYKVYHNDAFYQNASEPKFEILGSLSGALCITAVYETPNGESDCSNSIQMQNALQLNPRETRQIVSQGGMVFDSPDIFDMNGKKFSGSEMKAGTYFIRMNTNQGLIQQRILILD